MRLYLITTMLVCLGCGFAHAQDESMDRLMSKRIPTAKEAAYNMVLQVSRLHRENKVDTLAAFIDYYERNYGTTPELVPYLLLQDINNRTFKETLVYHAGRNKVDPRLVNDSVYYESSILGYYMLWYRNNFDCHPNKHYEEDIKEAYNQYYTLIVTEAKAALSNIKTLTPVEKWILNYLIDPDDSKFGQLSGSEYNGSALQRAWNKYHEEVPDIGGFGFALYSGVWSPTGRLGILGNHPYIGYSAGGKFDEHFMIDLRWDFRFIKTPGNYIVGVGPNKFATSYFFGMNLGVDGGYELFRAHKHEVDVIGGVAYEYMQCLSSRFIENNNLGSDAGQFNSVNLNAGISYRLYINSRRKQDKEQFGYVGIQGRYNWLFFNNNGGSNFSGGAWTIGLVFGYYSRKVSHYSIWL